MRDEFAGHCLRCDAPCSGQSICDNCDRLEDQEEGETARLYLRECHHGYSEIEHAICDNCMEDIKESLRAKEDHDNNSCRLECDICRDELNEQGEAMEPQKYKVDKLAIDSIRRTING